jgi:CBS domain-containing protein
MTAPSTPERQRPDRAMAEPDLVVADLMSLEPVVVAIDAPLEEAEQLMRDREVSGLPVVDAVGDLVGVISRTDVLEDGSVPTAILLRRRPSGLRVGELMTSPAVTVSPMTPLRDAALLMRDRRIHRLVAVDDAGRPVGVLSASDFVALYADG